MDVGINKDQTVRTVTTLGLMICLLGAIFYSYEYLLRIAPSVMTAQLMDHFDIDAPRLGFLSAFYYYAYVPMQLPVGMMMDKLGPRRLLTAACLICVFGTYLFICSKVFFLAALGRFLVGLGSAFAFVGVLKLASLWLPKSRFAMFAGLTSALGTIGAMFGDLLLTHWVSSIGWYKTLEYSAIAGIFLAVVLYFFIQDRKEPVIANSNTQNGSRTLRELAGIVVNPRMWLIGMIGCFIYLPTTVFAELWGVPYLEHAKHFTPGEAAWGASCLFLGFTIGAPLFGLLSDFLQTRRKVLLSAAVVAFVVVCTVLYAPGLNVIELDSLLLLLGLSYSAQTLVFAVGRELSPSSAEGTAVAVTNMIVMLGGMFLQPFVGVLLDWSWAGQSLTAANGTHVYLAADYQFALGIMPCGMVIAAILTLFLRETYGTQAK